MTIRERMRRRGWQRMYAEMWFRRINGVNVIIYGRDYLDPATIVIDPYGDEEVIQFGTEGIPSLAQRARALVRDWRTQ